MPTPVTSGLEVPMRLLRALVLAVVVLAGSLAVAVPAAAAAGTGAVAGTVSGDGGVGVAGVSVVVYEPGIYPAVTTLARTVTDAQGEYVLPRVPAGNDRAVCFDATAAADAPTEGYLSMCGTSTVWGGPDDYPGAFATNVRAGTTKRVDPTLQHAGGVTGRVTAADGSGLGGVEVWAGRNPMQTHVTTAADGAYHLRGVIPAADVAVCFDGQRATAGGSAAGYVSQCWDGVSWTGGAVRAPAPSLDADRFPVTADAAVTGIDATLEPGGGVAGTVRAGASGAPLSGLSVRLVSGSSIVGLVVTNVNGVFRFAGLPAGTQYLLCVDASAVDGVRDRTYGSQCWHERAWDPVHDGSTWAPDSDRFTVTAGVVGRFDVALSLLGHIAGDVTAVGGAPLADVNVVAYRGGQYYEAATTDSTGHYDVGGLPADPAGYAVCFYPSTTLNASRPGGYRAECHDNRYTTVFGPVPANVTRVPVTAGGTSTVDSTLAAATEFKGVVRLNGATAVGGVSVVLLDDTGARVGTTTSGVNGYDFVGLTPGRDYHVCVLAVQVSVFPGGYANRCNGGAVWSGALAAPSGAGLPGTAGHATRVDLDLTPGGSLSGQTGSRGDRFEIRVFDAAGLPVGDDLRFSVGRREPTYRVAGLTPATGPYTVCFRTPDDAGASPTGIAPTCWNGPGAPTVAWDGADADVPDVATVAVTADADVAGVDGGALLPGSGIAGTVRAGGRPAAGVTVTVFGTTGAPVRTTTTSATGTYAAAGLNPTTGPYRVCSRAPAGYRARCWSTAAWSGAGGPPAGAVPVGVTAGAVTTGINLTLPAS